MGQLQMPSLGNTPRRDSASMGPVPSALFPHWAMDVDVLFRCCGGDAVQGVPVFGRGDEYRADVGAAEQIAEIIVVGATSKRAIGTSPGIGFLDDRFECLALLPHRVAGGDDLGVGHAQQQIRVLPGAVSRADHAERNACAQRRMAVFAQSRSRHNRRRRRNGRASDLQKTPPGKLSIHWSPLSLD
jgi:hypothetical protein